MECSVVKNLVYTYFMHSRSFAFALDGILKNKPYVPSSPNRPS